MFYCMEMRCFFYLCEFSKNSSSAESNNLVIRLVKMLVCYVFLLLKLLSFCYFVSIISFSLTLICVV